MARQSPKLNVRLADEARRALREIWSWNAERYGESHADRYVQSLENAVARLVTEYLSGKPVPNRPELRFRTIRRKSKGYGHLAVYRIKGETVEVLNFFHTAQDWPASLESSD